MEATSANDRPAVWAEVDAPDSDRVPPENVFFLAFIEVPKFNSVVGTPANDRAAVRTPIDG